MTMLRRGILAAAGVLLSTGSANALTINLIDLGGVAGSPAEKGFALAARYWESVLTNDVTMNINVGFEDLGPNVLGGTSTSLYTYVPIDLYYDLLADNATKSAIDNAALATLRPTDANGSVRVTVPDYANALTQSGVTFGYDDRIAPTGEAISNTVAIASSNVKALINDSSFGANDIDAEIQFSNTFAFDFNPTDGIAPGTYDFIGVAIHEIGHALGFLSGVEDFDFVAGTSGFPVDEYWWGYSADLFRYSKPGKLDWTFGTAGYFSLDGGVTPYLDGFWSTGSERGDGWQASHWKEPGVSCGDFRGIMNPYICNGLTDQVEALDLALLDAIGWNTNVNVTTNPLYTFTTAQVYSAFISQVPEPATWAMMIGGIGFVGGVARRRRDVARAALA